MMDITSPIFYIAFFIAVIPNLARLAAERTGFSGSEQVVALSRNPLVIGLFMTTALAFYLFNI